MGSVTFSLSEFEEFIPNVFKNVGIVDQEYQFEATNDKQKIFVRSSIGADKMSGDYGMDSIRIFIQTHSNQYYRLSYTQRTDGWKERLLPKLREAWATSNKLNKGLELVESRECNNCFVGISKSKKNPGRVFVACDSCNLFQWL